ncbi:hypothetical protein BGX28_010424 [Mortierella sp. GBA30]|nr:hypothetical protein BGX28_010424 [Mortierella sp. GBA30]
MLASKCTPPSSPIAPTSSYPLNIMCVVDGDPVTAVIQVTLGSNESVALLKQTIQDVLLKRTKHSNTVVHSMKLWCLAKPIKDDYDSDDDNEPDNGDNDSIIISLSDTGDKKLMRPTKRIDHYFPSGLLSEGIYVIIGNIDEEEGLRSFKVFVKGVTRRNVSWTTDIRTATLDELRQHLRHAFGDIEDNTDNVTIHHHAAIKHGPNTIEPISSDISLRSTLGLYAMKGVMTLTFELGVAAKAFSHLNDNDLANRFGEDSVTIKAGSLNESPLDTAEQKQALENLLLSLEAMIVTFGKPQKEKGTTLYVGLFIAHAVALYGGKIKATPEYGLRSQHGNGSVDYSIQSSTGDKLVLGVIEVKYQDVQSGITQNAFQLHAALTNRTRQFDGARTSVKAYGIVTTLLTWTFMECTIPIDPTGSLGTPTFVTEEYPVALMVNAQQDEWKSQVKRIFGFLVWVLDTMLDSSHAISKKAKTL